MVDGVMRGKAPPSQLPASNTQTQINRIKNQEAKLNQKPRKGSHHVLEIKNALRVSTASRVQRRRCVETFAAGGGLGF